MFETFRRSFMKIPEKTLLLTVFILFLLISTICGQARADEIDDLIPAIIQVESSGNPNAVSKAGAIGLMQITPIVLKEYNQHAPSGFLCGIDLYNPYDNKAIGAWYLHRLKEH